MKKSLAAKTLGLKPIYDEVEGGKEAFRPKSAPGIFLSATQKAQAAEAKLEKYKDSLPVRPIDPNLVDFSVFANRIESSFKSKDFESLKADIKITGANIQPIKVRAKEGGRFEVIFGHRRALACKELGIQVYAIIVENMTDEQLWLEMQEENESRVDLTAYEQAKHYQKAIEAGVYKDWSAIADKLNKSRQALNRYSALASLPDGILGVFKSPSEVSLEAGQAISAAIKKNESAVLDAVFAVTGKNLPRATIIAKLSLKEELSTAVDKISIGTIKDTATGYQVNITKKIGPEKLALLREFLVNLDTD